MAQRVRCAKIEVAGEALAQMGEGLLALVAVAREDGNAEAEALARRLVQLRVFDDANGRMNRCLLDTGGTLGVVSQFTLYGDARRGRRPSYARAAPAEQAAPLIEALVAAARAKGVSVVTGCFGKTLEVALVNSGPVTILLDTDARF